MAGLPLNASHYLSGYNFLVWLPSCASQSQSHAQPLPQHLPQPLWLCPCLLLCLCFCLVNSTTRRQLPQLPAHPSVSWLKFYAFFSCLQSRVLLFYSCCFLFHFYSLFCCCLASSFVWASFSERTHSLCVD